MTTFDMNNATKNAFAKMDVYAIYLRKSRADEKAEKELGEGETLARHRKILTDIAVKKNLYIGEIYEEIRSGETIEGRPEIQRLIADCYAGKYKGILVVEVTRLSRGNQGDAQTIMDCLKYSNNNSGLLVITPTKTYDVAHNHEDEEYMEFELFMSRREFKMINKRMDRGRKQSVVEGNYMGSYRPYGYNIVKTRVSRTLVPNEAEAPIVKQIFEWTVKDGLSTYTIAKRLSAMGVPTYRGDKIWSRDTIKTILVNPVYIGKVKWNDRMKVKKMINGELKSSRPRSRGDQYMVYDGKHMKHALIDEETFNKAAERYPLDKTRENYRLVNPLAGMLFCEKCGKSMTLRTYDHSFARYTHKNAFDCDVKSVKMDDVLEALIHAMKMYIEDFEVKVDGMEEVDVHSIDFQLESMNKEIRKIEKKIDDLFDSWEDKIITNNEFVMRKNKHNERIEDIKTQMELLQETIPERIEYEDKIRSLHEALDIMLDKDTEASIKNKYVKTLFNKIGYSRENDKEFTLDITLR